MRLTRLRLGRPDLARYSDRFDVPAAEPDAQLSVMWIGVATLLLDDGPSALMTDGYFSRPGLAQVAATKVAPSPARVDECLARAEVSQLAAVIPVHTHIDHAMDSALVADRTGAQVVGGESADTGCPRTVWSSRSPVSQFSWAPSTSRWWNRTTARPTGFPG
jgi:glyoxylase-like metal-dependent hydrolase (beta-lactamase superfamily II)